MSRNFNNLIDQLQKGRIGELTVDGSHVCNDTTIISTGNGSSATISGADNCGIVADVTPIYGKFSNPSFLQLINKVVEVPTQNS